MSQEDFLSEMADYALGGSYNLRRVLYQQGDRFYNPGQAVGAIIGMVYIFAFMYYLSVKYFNYIIEDIVYLVNYKEEEDKELYRPIVYCMLNSIPVLAYTLSSVLLANYDSGVMLIFGTDMFNICLIYGLLLMFVILPVKKEGTDIDGWLLLRDTVWYSIGVGIFALFLFMHKTTWWAGLILIIYYLFHLLIQAYNDYIREEMYLLVGLKHEDDSFNADEQTRQKKRRISITELSYKTYIDKEEEYLQKKIMRMDALLRVKFKDQQKKKEIFSKWQVAVYTVIFAIRNKHKDEKQQRSINYAKLFQNPKNISVPSEENNSQPDIDQKQFPNEEEELINKGVEDEIIDKKNITIDRKNRQDDSKSQGQENVSNKHDGNEKYDKQNNDEGKSEKDVKPNQVINNEDPNNIEQYENMYNLQDKFQVELSLPANAFDKFCYIIFFPIHLIIFLLPNYHINPSHRKLAASFFFNVGIITGLMILLQYLMDNLDNVFGGHIATYSITVTSVCLQLPFFVYNYQFAKKEKDPVDFLLTFLQIGIFKVGVCVGFSLLINAVANLQEHTTIQFHRFDKFVLLIIIGIIFSHVVILNINNFKANAFVSKFLVVCYGVFLVSGIILLLL